MTVSLAELAAVHGPPPPAYFQRQAAAYFDAAVRQLAPGLTRPTVRAALRGLRNDVVLRGGAALGYHWLLQAAGLDAEALDLQAEHDNDGLAAALSARGGGRPVPPLRQIERQARLLAFEMREAARLQPLDGAALSGDVVFLLFFPGHVDDIIAVVDQLDELGVRSLLVATDDRTVTAVERTGRVAVRCGGDRRAIPAGHRWRWRISRSLGDGPAVGPPGSVGGDGSELSSVQRRLLADQLRTTLRRGFPTLYAFASQFDELLDRVSPGLVVAVNPYSSFGRTGLAAAGARGIGRAAIQHGSVFWSDVRWEDLSLDIACTWGPFSSDALLAADLEPEAVIVTGAPRLDHVEIGSPAVLDEVADRERSVLVAVSGAGDRISREQHLLFIDLLAEAVALTPSIRWVLKLHPKDDAGLYRQRLPADARNVELIDLGHDRARTSIYESLTDAACLVTVSSTTALDAIRVGVPVVHVVPIGEEDVEPDFVADVAARSASDAPSLVAVVAALLDEPSHQTVDDAMVARHLAHIGGAAEAVADVLAARLARDHG